MIEYGLSVSLEGTPRTPRTPRTQSPTTNTNLCNAPRKIMSFGDFNHALNEECDSISPRVLFPNEVSRRLDFSSLPLNDDHLSSVSFASASPVSIARTLFGGHKPEDGDGDDGRRHGRGCIGECGICYDPLQERTNHVFTMCGHLFCLRCLLKWWDTSTTCPMCREELYEPDAEAAEATEAAEADAYANEEAEEAAADVDEAADANESGDAWIQPPREYIERMQIQAQAYINDRVYWENSDSDESNAPAGDDNVEEDEQQEEAPVSNVRLMGLYLHQDYLHNWSHLVSEFGNSDPNFDDTVVSTLSYHEIQALQHNREIAMTLFARIRFRETLFSQDMEFLGGVHTGRWIPREDWIEKFTNQHDLNTGNTKMYEFVIRRGSAFSPVVETNVFGFIKETTIVSVEGSGGGGDGNGSADDDDWENLHEYAFVADIFTPQLFQLNRNGMRMNYGDYSMAEGTILPARALIRFSQIRRLYCMIGHERWSA